MSNKPPLYDEAGKPSFDGEHASNYQEPWLLRVLIVEDNVADFHWIKKTLESMDEFAVTIMHASCVSTAQAILRHRDFDLALVDYKLPHGMGDDVLAALKDRSSDCASIMLSGHTMAEVSLFALHSGAVSALSKDDLHPALLETTIRFALRNQSNARSLKEDRVE